MLLEYGFRNFFAFKEGATISFRLDSNCPESVSGGRDFSHVLCVKGANASGKTNVLRALSFLSTFLTRSFSGDADGPVPIVSHFENKDPIEMYAEFRIGEVDYRYEIDLTDKEVLREALFRTRAKQVRVFERRGSEVTYAMKAFSGLKGIKVRKNASIVSTAHQYQLKELENVYRFFDRFLSNVGFSGLNESVPDDSNVSKYLKENPGYLEFVNEFIRDCDVGVLRIEIFAVPDEKGERYFPCFVHAEGATGGVMRQTESSGTKALFRKLAGYKWALDHGGVLIADEFDIHLHPRILTKLLDLFLNPEINTQDAQLLFTTHSEEVMNLLGRYRTYLVNKENNESYAYRLDEIPGNILRNDRPILPAYQEGRIGGVPKI